MSGAPRSGAEEHLSDDAPPGQSAQRRRQFLRGTALATAAVAGVTASPAAAEATPVEQLITQPADGVNTPVFAVIPATPGAPRFEVQMNSYPNDGSKAGSYNQGMWLGWNAARFAKGSDTPDAIGLYMGMETNYYDALGDRAFGAEWYVGYETPDGSTVSSADLRPFYARVTPADTNSPDKSVLSWIDIGSGGSGSFAVVGSQKNRTELFVVHGDVIRSHRRHQFTAPGGSLQLVPKSGYAELDIVMPGHGPGGDLGVIAWRHVDTYVWSVVGAPGGFSVRDSTHENRRHLSLTPGGSDTTAQTTLRSNLQVHGGLGVNGAVPQAKAAPIVTPGGAANTYSKADAQVVVDAVNAIRGVLHDVGFTA